MKKLIICIVVFICFGCSGDQQDANESGLQLDSLKAKLNSTQHLADSLQQAIDRSQAGNSWFTTSIESRSLKQQGIENPEAHIEQSLRKKPELIPLEAVLGGTMRFTNIQVLGSQWIIAEYEDGHIMGRTIYEYTISAGGSIRFTELASTGKGN